MAWAHRSSRSPRDEADSAAFDNTATFCAFDVADITVSVSTSALAAHRAHADLLEDVEELLVSLTRRFVGIGIREDLQGQRPLLLFGAFRLRQPADTGACALRCGLY